MSFRSGNRRALDPEGAPGDLGIVQAFVNTADLRKGTDQLRDPAALADWLAAAGLLPPGTELDAADLERAREIREGLRSLIVAQTRGREAPEADELLDQAGFGAHLRVRFAGGTPRLESAVSGLDAALGRLFGFITLAHSQGLWSRLKVCAAPQCRAAFFDRSKTLTAKWCAPRCGNRINARASRRRTRRH